jgi:FxsC-like protein
MHVFFFSYASENLDPHMKQFFKALRASVAPSTGWNADDEEISFRDKENLRVMDTYQPLLLKALQSSTVLVCMTSPAYFQKEYCGKEYYIFDQRRRQGIGQNDVPPPVILPVIWATDGSEPPPLIAKIQQEQEGFPELYRSKGLRWLKNMKPAQYKKCVQLLADAIVRAWQVHKSIAALPIGRFEDIPDAFGQGDWHRAATPSGWLSGPDVANFVFATGSSADLKEPPGRYGKTPLDWRPYLPKSPKTVAEIAKEITEKGALKYREIPVDNRLLNELKGTKDRKNLTLVVANPRALTMNSYQSLAAFDALAWEGSSLLVPWDGIEGQWEDHTIQNPLTAMFPIVSQLPKPAFHAPLPTHEALRMSLEVTLTDLRAGLTKVETDRKPKTDDPPASVTSTADRKPDAT